MSALLGILVLSAREAGAQAASEIFAPEVVREVRVFMHSRDWQRLQERYGENTYYPADVVLAGARTRNVAVRSRGYGSRNASKPGLRLDFSHYVNGRRVEGLRAVVLDNLWQDPTLLREYMATAFLARMGFPTPRIAFVRVFVNDELMGLYAIEEELDETFLERALGDGDGYLFEYRWQGPYYFDDLGDALGSYAALFEPRTQVRAAAATLFTPLREMLRAPVDGDLAEWRSHVDRYLDLEQLVRLAASEAFLSEIDALTGYAGVNNFYVYRPAGSERHSMLPWDRDHAFADVETSVFVRVHENQLLRRALAFPDLQALYLTTLEEAAHAASHEAWLEEAVAAGAALIAPHVGADIRGPSSEAGWQVAISKLLDFARRRPQRVLGEVAGVRAFAAGRAPR